jgi:hypothetical protein
MAAGRPQKADAGTLYSFAHLFYWDFRRIAEGFTRQRLDRDKYERLSGEIDKMELQLSPEQKALIEEKAEEEIRNGRLKESERAEWIRGREDSWLLVIREDFRQHAGEEATRQLKVPGEPEVMTQLLEAETPDQVREICKDAFAQVNCKIAPGVFKELTLPNWPIPAGSTLPRYLSEYASEFLAAKSDPRFPKSTKRPSSHLKQFWFLSRALAGALYGVRTRTAINLVGSIRPEQMFEELRDGKPARKRMRIRHRSRHPS